MKEQKCNFLIFVWILQQLKYLIFSRVKKYFILSNDLNLVYLLIKLKFKKKHVDFS